MAAAFEATSNRTSSSGCGTAHRRVNLCKTVHQTPSLAQARGEWIHSTPSRQRPRNEKGKQHLGKSAARELTRKQGSPMIDGDEDNADDERRDKSTTNRRRMSSKLQPCNDRRLRMKFTRFWWRSHI